MSDSPPHRVLGEQPVSACGWAVENWTTSASASHLEHLVRGADLGRPPGEIALDPQRQRQPCRPAAAFRLTVIARPLVRFTFAAPSIEVTLRGRVVDLTGEADDRSSPTEEHKQVGRIVGEHPPEREACRGAFTSTTDRRGHRVCAAIRASRRMPAEWMTLVMRAVLPPCWATTAAIAARRSRHRRRRRPRRRSELTPQPRCDGATRDRSSTSRAARATRFEARSVRPTRTSVGESELLASARPATCRCHRSHQ